jgi:hypothetical protein
MRQANFKADQVADQFLFGSTFSTSFDLDHGFKKKFKILIDLRMIFEERRKSRNVKKIISEDLFTDLFHWDRQAIQPKHINYMSSSAG